MILSMPFTPILSFPALSQLRPFPLQFGFFSESGLLIVHL